MLCSLQRSYEVSNAPELLSATSQSNTQTEPNRQRVCPRRQACKQDGCIAIPPSHQQTWQQRQALLARATLSC